MANSDPVLGIELGPEFDQGNIQTDKIRLKLGTGLAIQPDGTIVATGGVTLTKKPLYETREIWAEESTGIGSNQYEWSFGNGATGVIGIPLGPEDDWEVVSMYFHANNYSVNARATVAMQNFADVTNMTTISEISLVNSTDGTGSTNNATKFVDYATPITVPANAVIGFRTLSVNGSISNARVGVRLRRKIGEYISDIN